MTAAEFIARAVAHEFLDPPGIALDVPALFGGPPPGQPAANRP